MWPGFWNNLTAMAKRLLDDLGEAADKSATNFEIRSKALTRPAYTEPAGILKTSSSKLSSRSKSSAQGTPRTPHTPHTPHTPGAGTGRGSIGEGETFNGTRESHVAATVYGRFQMSLENQSRAEEARIQRQRRDEIREDMAQQQYEETQATRARMRGRNQQAKLNLVNRNLEKGQVVREERAEISRKIEARQERMKQEHKAKLEESGGGYANENARLAAEEEELAEGVKQEAQRVRLERRQALKTSKKIMADKNRHAAETRRAENSERLAWAIAERNRKKAEAADSLRADTARHMDRFALVEEERSTKVEQTMDRIKSMKAKAARARDVRRKRLQDQMGRIEKWEDQMIAESKEETLRQKKGTRNHIFGQRYVSANAADEFERSAFRKLYAMDDKADAEIATQNLEILERIENVEQRTDDLIDDDAAGDARITFAEESRQRRAALQAEISQANAEHRERIRNKQPAVDDLLDNEAAAIRRKEMRQESEARREAEALKAAEKSAALQQRLLDVKAATDNDVTDDATGEARRQAARASAARKKAEAERIARENSALKERLRTTAARTDDDVMDEDAGAARSKMAQSSKSRRASEAAILAKSNADERRRLSLVQAVVDDDIEDDPAGAARDAKRGVKRAGVRV